MGNSKVLFKLQQIREKIATVQRIKGLCFVTEYVSSAVPDEEGEDIPDENIRLRGVFKDLEYHLSTDLITIHVSSIADLPSHRQKYTIPLSNVYVVMDEIRIWQQKNFSNSSS